MRGQRHAESADPPKPGWLLTLARKARTTKWAVGGYRFLPQKVVPAGFLGLSAILVFSLGNSAAFDVVNTIGTFCTSTKEVKDASLEGNCRRRQDIRDEYHVHATGFG